MIKQHRQPRTPAEMTTYGDRAARPSQSQAEHAAAIERSGIRLASSPDHGEAARLWQTHVDAGRIGVPAPAPPSVGEYKLASLARILGRPHPGRGA